MNRKPGRPAGSVKGVSRKLTITISEDNFEWLCAAGKKSEVIGRLIKKEKEAEAKAAADLADFLGKHDLSDGELLNLVGKVRT